uniref:Uncharacterized protein n=1 Tax=Manihot esculenta TaxID=3983 RepID=A0A2C9U6P3_MANES
MPWSLTLFIHSSKPNRAKIRTAILLNLKVKTVLASSHLRIMKQKGKLHSSDQSLPSDVQLDLGFSKLYIAISDFLCLFISLMSLSIFARQISLYLEQSLLMENLADQ